MSDKFTLTDLQVFFHLIEKAKGYKEANERWLRKKCLDTELGMLNLTDGNNNF